MSDPDKRKRYDSGVDLEDFGGFGGGGMDPNDIFKTFFGGAGIKIPINLIFIDPFSAFFGGGGDDGGFPGGIFGMGPGGFGGSKGGNSGGFPGGFPGFGGSGFPGNVKFSFKTSK